MSHAPVSWILSEDFAGLWSQALGVAEAAGIGGERRALKPGAPWKFVPARLWPNPLAAVGDAVQGAPPDIAFGCGGMAGAVLAALRRRGTRVVEVQNPRMPIDRFDVIVANTHDELTGPNVIVVRTAIHRVTQDRLTAEAALWRDRFAHLPRPLVAMLLGGSNGRYRLGPAEGARIAADLVAMMKRDKVGLMVTPSRRTDPAVTALIRDAVAPLGGYVWDLTGDNPYFGMVSLADLIIVTQDSVSMISEAAATSAPVLIAALPGKSRRQGLFLDTMRDAGRVRMFDGRFTEWPVSPMNDTPEAGAEVRRRLGL